MDPIILARGIDRVFGSGQRAFQALHSVDMDILPRRLTVLRGRSGSGKTCMVNILGALDAPSAGSVMLGGRDIIKLGEMGKNDLRRTQFGFIFQSFALISTMSAYENVELMLRLAGIPRQQRHEKAVSALTDVGLEKRMQHYPAELSGGEQQRVAIARAIVHSPKILFADEPTAELDSSMAYRVVEIFKRLARERDIAILMTTHDVAMMDLADDVYTLSDGRIIEHMHVTPVDAGVEVGA